MRKIALLGASGHGKVVADMALLLGYQDISFYDDAWPKITENSHWPVVGNTDLLLRNLNQYDGVVVTIGDCVIRLKKHHTLQEAGARLVSLVHPRAWISHFSSLGAGSVLMAGAYVNIDSAIGQACIINTGATVDHDCKLFDGVHISPGANLSGGVIVLEGAWVGVGASIREGIEIGSYAIIGAGSAVTKSIDDDVIVVGNPAKVKPT
jgi:sugar O-acyltransferase (sialic acid O-acetyltransferase NeuD family)